jgi:hypothetical protein
MKNSKETENIYAIYQEGIFDRVGARIKGIGNTKLFGGSGYNAGKAESFKGKFYARIIKDIDKFLKEVQTMNKLSSLDEFESKYPEMARKIACMADAVGHTTQLKTQCKKAEDVEVDDKDPVPPIDPDDTDPVPPIDPDDTDPVPPIDERGVICTGGKCREVTLTNGAYKRNKVYSTLEECEKKCRQRKKKVEDVTDGVNKVLAQQGVDISNINARNVTIIIGNNNDSVQEVFQANGVPFNDKNKKVIEKEIVKKAKQTPAKKVPAKKVPAKKKVPNTP